MNRIFTWLSLFMALLATVPSFGQTTYGHEWIDFSNPNPYFKIKVAEDGVYRIDYNALSQALSESGHNINLIDPRELQLFHRGEQVPIYVFGESNGQFNTSDFIEFIGEKNDGWLDTELYEKAKDQPNKYYSNFTDTAAYFLTWNGTSGQQYVRYTEQANDLTNLPPKENYFMHTAVREFHNSWHGGKSYLIDGVYLNDSRFERGEGYVRNPFNKSAVTQSLSIPNIYSSGPAATVHTNLIGIYNQEHRTRFSINNTVIADVTYGELADGDLVYSLVNQVPLNVFKNNGQPDEFKYEALGTGSSDRQTIGYIGVEYPHTYDFDNLSQFRFKVFGTAGNSKYLEVTNFDYQGQPPVLFDATNKQRIEGVVSGSTIQFNVPFNTTGAGDLYLVAGPQIKNITSLVSANFVDFSDPVNQGDFLMVSGKVLRDDGQGNDWVDQYRQYRSSANGGGWQVLNIDVEILYDQFAYGIDKHPISIRRFVHFALDSFQSKPKHLFLIGKALEYNWARTDVNRYRQNIVPTFGNPGSDMLLTARDFKIVPELSVGRLAARNGTHVRTYLDKVKALEQNQRTMSAAVKDKAWTKRVMHFGGGNTAWEQNLFRNNLTGYEQTIEDSFYGAHVHSFFKTSSDPIQYLQSEFIDSLVNDGVSLITFFGHSNANSFDVSLDNPSNYENYGKYPLILSNGCFSGQIHSPNFGISEQFIFEKDKGAISFIASTSYGEVLALNNYSSRFYRNLSRNFYGEDIGTVMWRTIKFLTDTISPGPTLRFLTENNTLHGDPAINLNTHRKPDYAVEAPMIDFEPKQVSVDIDSFVVKVRVLNLGRAQSEQLTVEVKRQFSDGSITLQSKTIPAPHFNETVSFKFYTDPIAGVNQNIFTVELDPEIKLDEGTRANNIASTDLFIKSNEAFPVYPYPYSIVTKPDVVLKASTANPLAEEQEYVVEIDTTEEFNSMLLQSHSLYQAGGLVKWDNIPVSWVNEQVYYWRISPAFPHPDSAKWKSSSFVYVTGGEPGWNQSHYYQFLPDYYANIELTSNRNFKFVDDLKSIRVTNGVYPNTIWEEVAAYYINSEQVNRWSCIGKGLVIAVIDSVTGLPWNNRELDFGEIHCEYSRRHAFHYKTSDPGQRKDVVDLLDAVPNGNYILVMSFQNYEYKQYNGDTSLYGTSIFKKLEELGANGVMALDTLPNTPPFVFFVQKGDIGSATTVTKKDPKAFIDTSFSVSGLWNQGYIQSLQIGPAKGYGNVSWTALDPQNTDYISLDVIGVKPDGSKTTLLTGIQTSDTNIQALSAIQYPGLELKLNVKDDSLRSAAQLRKWRVTYDPVGDVAVRPDLFYTFHHDTLQQGEQLQLGVALQNITDYAIDSLLVSLHLIRSDNQREQLKIHRYKPLQPGDTIHFTFSMDTYGYSGTNTLLLEANPDNDQPEQYRFNNLLSIPFEVEKDIYNPLLDVTFDGIHIMDGDIVSTKPAISIQLKDENSFLRLDDTSSMDIYIQYPSTGRKRLAYNNDILNFIPASENGSNEARVELEPVFTQDGTYMLIVRARDKTGNSAGGNDYQVSFEVITRNAISNVLNYPNPFTSSTQFVFTLTGSTVPDYLKIQIMTVSGKVVREITKDELGPLHVGTNLTEFRWDGTDQYGDPLANGLYFYRVIARLGGQEMELYQLNSVDRYFKSGLGKMYLAR